MIDPLFNIPILISKGKFIVFLLTWFLISVDIIGQDDPDYAASAISVYGGVQMGGGGGGGAASEANFSTISSASRPDPDLESKRKAYVSVCYVIEGQV